MYTPPEYVVLITMDLSKISLVEKKEHCWFTVNIDQILPLNKSRTHHCRDRKIPAWPSHKASLCSNDLC